VCCACTQQSPYQHNLQPKKYNLLFEESTLSPARASTAQTHYEKNHLYGFWSFTDASPSLESLTTPRALYLNTLLIYLMRPPLERFFFYPSSAPN
jgi:hypothetical protein